MNKKQKFATAALLAGATTVANAGGINGNCNGQSECEIDLSDHSTTLTPQSAAAKASSHANGTGIGIGEGGKGIGYGGNNSIKQSITNGGNKQTVVTPVSVKPTTNVNISGDKTNQSVETRLTQQQNNAQKQINSQNVKVDGNNSNNNSSSGSYGNNTSYNSTYKAAASGVQLSSNFLGQAKSKCGLDISIGIGGSTVAATGAINFTMREGGDIEFNYQDKDGNDIFMDFSKFSKIGDDEQNTVYQNIPDKDKFICLYNNWETNRESLMATLKSSQNVAKIQGKTQIILKQLDGNNRKEEISALTDQHLVKEDFYEQCKGQNYNKHQTFCDEIVEDARLRLEKRSGIDREAELRGEKPNSPVDNFFELDNI